MKEAVYRQGRSPSFDDLRQRIHAAVESITPDQLINAVYHSLERFQMVLDCEGGHIQHLSKLTPSFVNHLVNYPVAFVNVLFFANHLFKI